MRKNRQGRKRRKKAPRKREIEIEVIPVDEIEEPDNFLFYGRQGTGKTTLASSFPKPILIIDALDAGTKSIRDVKDIAVVRINSWEEFEACYWFIKDKNKWKTIVIDTVSQVQLLATEELLQQKGKSTENIKKWGSVSRKDWADIAAVLKRWIVNYRDLDPTTVFLSQQRTFNIKEDDEPVDDEIQPEIGAAVIPSVRTELNACVSVICNTFIRNRLVKKQVKNKRVEREISEYCLRVGPHSLYDTKMRKPKGVKLPKFLVDPSYEDIIDLMEDE